MSTADIKLLKPVDISSRLCAPKYHTKPALHFPLTHLESDLPVAQEKFQVF